MFSLLCQLPALVSLSLVFNTFSCPLSDVSLELVPIGNWYAGCKEETSSLSHITGCHYFMSLTLYASLGLHFVSPGLSPSPSQYAVKLWYKARVWCSPACHPATTPLVGFLSRSISGCCRWVCHSTYLWSSSTAEIIWRQTSFSLFLVF